MSAASAAIQESYPSDHSDEAMSNNGEGRNVRARITVAPILELDLELFSLKDKGKGKNGHNSYPLINNEVIRFNLTDGDWLRVPFGFDINSKFEKPSFLGGKAPENANASEGLSLKVELLEDRARFMQNLDLKAATEFAKLAEAKWNAMLTTNPLFNSTLMKVAVILKGSELTKLAIVVDGKVHRGEGWDFLEPFVSRCNAFKFADVKMTVRVKKLWHVAGKAGLGLEATQLVLRPSERPTEVDAFDNDDELLA